MAPGAAPPAAAPQPAYLFPAPRTATLRATVLPVSPALQLLAVGATDPILAAALLRYANLLFAYGPGAPPPPDAVGVVTVNVTTPDVDLRLGVDESYSVSAAGAGGATITAPTVFGALHALETLAQLIQFNLSSQSYYMPACTIVDAPRFPWRGVLVDTARHFLSPAALRAVVDLMAADKLNVLCVMSCIGVGVGLWVLRGQRELGYHNTRRAVPT